MRSASAQTRTERDAILAEGMSKTVDKKYYPGEAEQSGEDG